MIDSPVPGVTTTGAISVMLMLEEVTESTVPAPETVTFTSPDAVPVVIVGVSPPAL